MNFHILTLFPEIVRPYFESSIMRKAIERGLVSCNIVNIRDFAHDKHKTCDDGIYGGGAGMLMLPEPLGAAIESLGLEKEKRTVIYVTPAGKTWTQKAAESFRFAENIVLICGRYEGVDERIIERYVDAEISVGDYVLSSGEVAALVIADSIYRLCDGVISGESLAEESFTDGLLEYPQWTRPEEYAGMRVPEVLLSGHHENIRKWRLEKRLQKTLKNRPDLIAELQKSGTMSAECSAILEKIANDKSCLR
ncbi:MAG: tRNA (guanosine(37)-N1)-methyltransferase TrmD [Treponemataceae bacterium]|nr:MAG: tRNA (guanosine(37)-N1)-methyltransferase TrmD [Treponemataceae bacterium]